MILEDLNLVDSSFWKGKFKGMKTLRTILLMTWIIGLSLVQEQRFQP